MNLDGKSEMCCTRLTRNAGRKKSPKIRHLWTVQQLCRAMFLQLRHVFNDQKQLVKDQYLLYVSSQYGELQFSNGWDWLVSLGHPNKFQRVSRFGFVTAATWLNGSQPNFARCLAVSCAGTLYIHFRELLPTDLNLVTCNFVTVALSPSLVFSYISSITARHCSSGR